jgi:hypothetical protein
MRDDHRQWLPLARQPGQRAGSHEHARHRQQCTHRVRVGAPNNGLRRQCLRPFRFPLHQPGQGLVWPGPAPSAAAQRAMCRPTGRCTAARSGSTTRWDGRLSPPRSSIHRMLRAALPSRLTKHLQLPLLLMLATLLSHHSSPRTTWPRPSPQTRFNSSLVS